MSRSAAFFDVDETLITIKSMFNFFEFWCRERGECDRLERYMSHFKSEVKKGTAREQLNRDYYREFAGVKYQTLIDAGEKWFAEKKKQGLFIDSAVCALKKHQSDVVNGVFISGSMLPLLLPIAHYLGVKDILCAPLRVDSDGVVTGNIGVPQTIGVGKKEALIQYCHQRNIDPALCYAYGDDLSDIPMLESVGNPICVGHETALARHAIQNHWQII